MSNLVAQKATPVISFKTNIKSVDDKRDQNSISNRNNSDSYQKRRISQNNLRIQYSSIRQSADNYNIKDNEINFINN